VGACAAHRDRDRQRGLRRLVENAFTERTFEEFALPLHVVATSQRTNCMVVRSAPTVLSGRPLTLPLAGGPNAEGRWAELDAALAELRKLLPASANISASIVLAPPLVQLRRIALPPLKSDERRRVLCRDASRWFVGAREAFVADALPIVGATGDVMAAATPARYADAIVRAASSARIEIRTVQPAPWAWAASLDRSRRVTTRALVVPGSRAFDVVWLALGAVTGARRLREGADLEARLDVLLADGDAGTVVRIADPMAVAAEHADRARGPEFLPESVRASRRATVMRRARTIALAAAAMLVVAAGIGGIYVYLAYKALRIVLAGRAPSASAEDQARAVLHLPGGSWVLTLVALGFAVGAGAQFWKAYDCHFMRHLREGVGHKPWVKWTGRLGYAARGVIFCVVAWLLYRAAADGAAGEAGNLEKALDRPCPLQVCVPAAC